MLTLFWLFFMSATFLIRIDVPDSRSVAHDASLEAAGASVSQYVLGLDEEIIGKVGFQRYEVNAFGKRIRQIELDKGESGQNFKTTLDLDVQEFTAKTIENLAASVCAVSYTHLTLPTKRIV